jgi:hypothetical protein
VTVRVDAVTYFNVVGPVRAVVAIQNYRYATSQVARTTLAAVLERHPAVMQVRNALFHGRRGLGEKLTLAFCIPVELLRFFESVTANVAGGGPGAAARRLPSPMRQGLRPAEV